MLLTYLHCNDCQKDFEFTDNLGKKAIKMSKEECKDYSLSLIKKTKNNNFEYVVNVNCKRCSDNMNMTFTEKERNFNFKCKNCSLKGINFNYFLSQEEDNNPKNENNGINNNDINKAKDPSIYDNSVINFPIPINSPQIYTNQPSDHYPYPDNSAQRSIQSNRNEPQFSNSSYKDHPKPYHLDNKIKNNDSVPLSVFDKNMKGLSKVESQKREVNTGYNIQNKKGYYTPDISLKKQSKEKIKVTFIKQSNSYVFEFNLYDIIRNQIDKVKEKMNLVGNPIYYNNSNKVDINKTFKENNIYNDSIIEIEDDDYNLWQK
jgi:hypothetical protein